MINRKCAIWLCCFIISLKTLLIEGKYISGRTTIQSDKVKEITKFNFGIGTGYINGTFEFRGIPKGTMYLFMDTRWWSKFHAEEACDKIKHAHMQIPIGETGSRIGRGLGNARGSDLMQAPKGKKRWNFKWEITHRGRTYGWYMVIADCPTPSKKNEGDTKKKKKSYSRKFPVNYEMELMNEGDDHLSVDERWIAEIYLLTTIGMIAGWFYFSRLMKKTFGNGPRHLIITFIRSAYMLQIVSMVLELIHQFFYRGNGTGIWLFDFFSELIEGASQTLISFVLLCLANGWTISQRTAKNKYDPSMGEVLNNPSLLDIDNPVLLLLIVFMFLSICLQLANKLYDDSFMKFHDHETWAGFSLMMLRLIFGVLFFFTLYSTIQSEKKKGAGSSFVNFLYSVMVLGSAWFLAFPTIVFLASFFTHYLRHFLVTSGVLLSQSVCLALLSHQFGSERSAMAKFSEVQQSGMLPGFSRVSGGNKYV